MHIGDIKDVELDQLHALSISVRWPHRAEDWEFLRQTGSGIVALDEIGRVMGSAMWFPHGDGFATIGMVITSPRLQTNGTGQWLMNGILDKVAGRRLSLSATQAARRLYLSLDFKPEKTVYQCQGEARIAKDFASLALGGKVRQLGADDLEAILRLDTIAFGADRSELLRRLDEQSIGYGLFHGADLQAFALCRPFGRGHVVGPVVALNDADAIAVVAPHVARHAGQFLRLDTHMETGDFASYVSQCGMIVYDTVLTMSLGNHPANRNKAVAGTMATYALVSQALG
ncbi:GNAT family N-acetyltransferase [Rhizobium sp. NPDC090279]|uniref:GNAT family N-acetyltransferase n=1 Tax=Rhizobium sp. NPDC090279 TaxID=3364499 RepID=UPI00383AFD7D